MPKNEEHEYTADELADMRADRENEDRTNWMCKYYPNAPTAAQRMSASYHKRNTED